MLPGGKNSQVLMSLIAGVFINRSRSVRVVDNPPVVEQNIEVRRVIQREWAVVPIVKQRLPHIEDFALQNTSGPVCIPRTVNVPWI